LIPFFYSLKKGWQNRNDLPAGVGSICLLLLASLICWFFMPGRVPGQSYIFDRFSVFCLLSFILLTGGILRTITIPWKIFILIGCMIHALLWSKFYFDFQKENASFNAGFFPGGQDKTLCGVMFDKRFRGRNVYQHFPLYYIVWKQGIACARFIDMRYVTLIRRKASQDQLPKYIERSERGFNLARQYGGFDYLLIRNRSDVKAGPLIKPFRLLRSAKRWSLYENAHNPN
jgi:hypothetical protein